MKQPEAAKTRLDSQEPWVALRAWSPNPAVFEETGEVCQDAAGQHGALLEGPTVACEDIRKLEASFCIMGFVGRKGSRRGR